jgi:hypothetical protein
MCGIVRDRTKTAAVNKSGLITQRDPRPEPDAIDRRLRARNCREVMPEVAAQDGRSGVLMHFIRHRMPGSVSLFIWWFRETPASRHRHRSWAGT